MRFIDDYRLLGVVDRKPLGQEVMLWDAAILGDTRIPRQLVFKLSPSYKTLNSGEQIVCNLESNCELPFRADPSMQLVGIKVIGRYVNNACPSVLLVRSEVLSGFSSRIGMTSTIKWEDWSHFTKSLPIGGLWDAEVHLSHSHLVCLVQSSTRYPPQLCVFNFSLEYKRREGDSGAIGEYSEQLIPVNEEIFDGTSYLSTSNIIFPQGDYGSVSSVGAPLASSGLNSISPSTLVRRTRVGVGVFSIGVLCTVTRLKPSRRRCPVAVQPLKNWVL